MKGPLKNSVKNFITAAMTGILFLKPQIAYASSRFIDRAGSSIYQGARNKTGVDELITTVASIIDWGADVVGGLLSGLIVLLANSIYVIMGNMGMTLDAIIYGRVFNASYMTEGVAMYTYDTTNGNIYGIVSMVIFSVLSSIVFMAALVRLMTAITGFIYTNGGPQKRDELKEQVTKFIIAMLSIALAPALLDLAIYVRDLCLYQVGLLGNSLINDMIMGGYGDTFSSIDMDGKNAAAVFFATDSPHSITNQFRMIATDGNFLNALMYLGSLALTIYFAFTYIGAALSMVALVGFLPVAIVYDNFEKGMLGSWLKSMFGILMIPIIDSTLLLVPIMIGGISVNIVANDVVPVMPFIQFIACATIIPARSYVRQLLGIRGSSSMEMAGLTSAAIGARAVAGMIKNTSSMYQKNKESKAESKADAESALSNQDKAAAINATSEQLEQQGMDYVNQTGQSFMEPLKEEQMEGFSSSQKAEARMDNLAGGINRMNEYAQKRRNDQKDWQEQEAIADARITDTDAQIAELRSQKADIEATEISNPEDKQNIRQAVLSLNRQIATKEKEKARYKEEKAVAAKNKNEAARDYERLTTASRNAGQTLSEMERFNRNNGVSRESDRLDREATIENFELPAYKNISAERKAQLYQERALARDTQRQRETVGSVAGATVGATIGLGAGMTTPIAGMTASVGGSLGSAVGKIPSSKVIEKRSAKELRNFQKNQVPYEGYESIHPETTPVEVDRTQHPAASSFESMHDIFKPEQVRHTVNTPVPSSDRTFEYTERAVDYYAMESQMLYDRILEQSGNSRQMYDLIKETYSGDVMKTARNMLSQSSIEQNAQISGRSFKEATKEAKEEFLKSESENRASDLFDNLYKNGYITREYMDQVLWQGTTEREFKQGFVNAHKEHIATAMEKYLTCMGLWPKEGGNPDDQ